VLLLIRHAESEFSRNGYELLYGSHDAPLSDVGRLQTEQLRNRLAHQIASALYCSPLRRASALNELGIPVPSRLAFLLSLRLRHALRSASANSINGALSLEQILQDA
jgi:broad specificity phosphatase PhoE